MRGRIQNHDKQATTERHDRNALGDREKCAHWGRKGTNWHPPALDSTENGALALSEDGSFEARDAMNICKATEV
jgi:hypothetical protein